MEGKSDSSEHKWTVAFFDAKSYEKPSFKHAIKKEGKVIKFKYYDHRLNAETASLAKDADAVCVFINDTVDSKVVDKLKEFKIKLLLLRCAGFNHVDLKACEKSDITVVRVPAYSPYAIAEHATALMLALNRRINRAYNRTREGNFALQGLMGFDMHGKTVGVIGTGKIGKCLIDIMLGFGCHVLCQDKMESDDVKELAKAGKKVKYVELDELLEKADIISVHAPLTDETKHLIDADAIKKMKEGVMVINTSRGALLDTAALIAGLKSKKIGFAGLDVIEEEADYIFEDNSSKPIKDDLLSRLLTFPNVIVTGHQAFFTSEAMETIASTTVDNALAFLRDKKTTERPNLVKSEGM
eukprot:TRINITY_DN6361_c0_g1_i1.p1 TRINITY_DN6361_c0_g1~~TRINITY_DN6361_c0_g1_i1.p1  ORF type:complete len:355 (+),score=78.57 TRINITY_DN6361_c0_g1_i1:1017-2081(+)